MTIEDTVLFIQAQRLYTALRAMRDNLILDSTPW